MRTRLRIIAGGLGVLGVFAFVISLWFAPKILRIAVGPLTSSDMRVAVSFLQALQHEGAPVRLKLVLTESATASSEALDHDKADLAIARPDVGLPVQSATVAIMRRDAVYFVTRPGLGITQISDLKNRSIGIIAQRPANDRVLSNILGYYDIMYEDITRLALPQADMLQAVQEGRVDAVFLVTPLADRFARQIKQAFAQGNVKKPAELLVISEAAALIAENPAFDTVDIPRGAFGINPAFPGEDETTLAITHRLVARRDIDETTISELTRLLFTLRLQIAAEVPAANQIEIPSTEDRGAKLPIHPGTIAYVEGETKSFFDRYGDWFYLGVMAVSLVGSAVAALFSGLIGPRRHLHPDAFLKRLVRLLHAAGTAESEAALATIESEAEKVVQGLMAVMARNDADAGRIAAMGFLSAELRIAIAKRRALLAKDASPPPALPA